MSNYLGPDVYSDNPRCSASQRLAKGLPPYTLMHIGSSSVTVAQLQNLYYNVLRNANSSLLLHPDLIYMYLKGYLPLEPIQTFPKFTSFFPMSLHPQKRYSPSHEIVKGIVVIDDPAVACISEEELQRFRCLSRLNDLKIDRVMFLSPRPLQLDETRGTEQDCLRNGEEISNGVITNQDIRQNQEMEQDCARNANGIVSDQGHNSFLEPQETGKQKQEEKEAVSVHAICGISKTAERFRETYKRKRFKKSSKESTNRNGETLMERDKTHKPTSLALTPVTPDLKECDAEPSVVTKGTASKGTLGPSIAMVGIGVTKVAYFFQVALPGVRRDYGEFSCEIESDGKVILEGSATTGEKTIKRHSRVFEMNIRKLSPPGPFKLCFSLPGPVDPRLFSPNFRSDGIFEAVIIKHKDSN